MIREFEPADAEGVSAALHEEELPEPVTAAGILHWSGAQPDRARARVWVAEEDGRIVGWAEGRLRWSTSVPGVADFWAYVVPSWRGRGLGAELYEQVERHLRDVGASKAESWTYTPGGERLLGSRGFQAEAKERTSLLRLAEADTSMLPALESAKAAEGFRLVALREVRDRPEELHRVYAAASADVPEYFREDDVRLEEWRRETLEHPQLSGHGGFVVLSGNQPVALAFVQVDEPAGIVANELTGTLHEFRRRGLARLAKLATIRWAAEHDFETMVTGNAETNVAMLGLNESLGYRPVRTETHFVHHDLS
jgi:GNAT superfamily N-acetyltransferase